MVNIYTKDNNYHVESPVDDSLPIPAVLKVLKAQ